MNNLHSPLFGIFSYNENDLLIQCSLFILLIHHPNVAHYDTILPLLAHKENNDPNVVHSPPFGINHQKSKINLSQERISAKTVSLTIEFIRCDQRIIFSLYALSRNKISPPLCMKHEFGRD